jgi:hypothetical protein
MIGLRVIVGVLVRAGVRDNCGVLLDVRDFASDGVGDSVASALAGSDGVGVGFSDAGCDATGVGIGVLLLSALFVGDFVRRVVRVGLRLMIGLRVIVGVLVRAGVRDNCGVLLAVRDFANDGAGDSLGVGVSVASAVRDSDGSGHELCDSLSLGVSVASALADSTGLGGGLCDSVGVGVPVAPELAVSDGVGVSFADADRGGNGVRVGVLLLSALFVGVLEGRDVLVGDRDATSVLVIVGVLVRAGVRVRPDVLLNVRDFANDGSGDSIGVVAGPAATFADSVGFDHAPSDSRSAAVSGSLTPTVGRGVGCESAARLSDAAAAVASGGSSAEIAGS